VSEKCRTRLERERERENAVSKGRSERMQREIAEKEWKNRKWKIAR